MVNMKTHLIRTLKESRAPVPKLLQSKGTNGENKSFTIMDELGLERTVEWLAGHAAGQLRL